MSAPDRARFWDERILAWEASRYEGRPSAALGPGEWLASVLSEPTRLRQELGVKLAAPFLAGRRVVEAGCGTGLLARRFMKAGAAGYLGIDHSRVAIEAARRRSGSATIRFEVGSAADLPAGGDMIVSLGMIDWLTDEELRGFFARHGEADFLHTFNEYRAEPAQLVHRALRSVDAALRPRAVRPRYMTLESLIALFPERRRGSITVHRDPRLRYATFISSLPVRA
jgi:SAM-dependent methyltransferase